MRPSGTSRASSSSASLSQPPEHWQDYTELKDMLKALGDIARLNIVHALSAGDEVKVTELAVRLAVSQPLVSWHLSILRRHGLVRTRRQGREVYCSLDTDRFQRCLSLLALVSNPPADTSPPGALGPPAQLSVDISADTHAPHRTTRTGLPGL
ncbi:MAG TPA: metalloregulator ArsR/SmtB family transcription factor [Ktedonobacterales bacterium]